MDALAEAAKPLRYPDTPRALFLALLVTICFAGSNLPLASSQDSCSNGLVSLGGLVPFNTTGLACFQAWPTQDFILRFGKEEAAAASNNVWSFVLSAPDSGGYISIGFSPTGRMVGSSAVVGWATSDGAGSARQYYLGGTTSRACPPDQGKLTLPRGAAAAPTVVSKGSRLYLAFQIAGQPLTDVVYAVGPSGSLPGSSGLLSQHQDMASGTISLSGGTGAGGGGSPATGGGDRDGDDDGGEGGEGKGKSKPSGEGSGDDGDEGKGERRHTSPSSSSASGSVTSDGGLSSKRQHGVLAAVSCWGATVPVGIAIARFFKHLESAL